MALQLLAANNAQSVLAAGISASATSLTLNTGTGALFPSPVSGTSFFKLTLIDAATGSLTEIVHVTARAGDVFTIQRGQEGTVPRAWSANDIAANMMTAGTLSYILGNFQPLDPTLTALAALVGVANKLPYFNGDDTAALTDLTQVGRDIIGKSTIADILTYLGLGTAAEIDVATNAEVITGTANKAVTAASLKNRFNTVVLYPNGTESAPPTLTANQRIVIDNPFPGRPVVAQVEVFANGIWAEPYFMVAPYGNSGPAAGATPSYLYETDKIVIQTGNDGVLYRSSISGSAHNLSGGGDAFGGSIYSSRTYRLRVRAI